ncbi:MAG: polysaccharide biosynthesis tyrosine autokinase [Bacteroidetes bacterium]|nr:polysaccharide biosynthesis tyrosine autokinase [Bacteroidota bacterium]
MAEVKNTSIIDIKDLKRVWRLLSENWYIILVFFILSIIGAYLYSYKLPKIYASKAQVLLENNETYSYQEGLYKGLGITGTGYEKIANQQRVLTSIDLLSKVIAKLKLDVSYFIVGRIQTKEVFSGNPFFVEAQVYSPNYYELPFTFKIKDEKSFELSYEENGSETTLVRKFGEPIINNNFYFTINKSSGITKSTLASLKEITYQFIVHDRQNLMYKYKSAISVENLEYSAILEVSMEDISSEHAVAFLDTLCKVYIDNSLKSQIKINENTITYIDRQLDEVVTILDSIENILVQFKEQKNILDLSKEEDMYYQNLTDFEVQKRKYEMQLKSVTYLKDYITSNMNKELLPPSVYVENNDAYLTKAIGDLYDYQVQINSSMFTTTEKSTVVKELEYKVELLRSDILKYLVNLEKAVNEKINTVADEILFYESKLKMVPSNQRQMMNIDRKAEVYDKMYLYLLQKRAETVIAKAGIISDISVIESAHSIGVVKPNMNKIYYSFMSAAIIIALLIAFIRTTFFGKIKTVDELRELTQLPIVGEVFHSKEAKDSYLIVDSNPRSFVTEAFRSVRTNLDYLAPEAKNKIILITSNRPSAGKTFCSINLGTILAKGGKKVLLMEMDLHKPKIHSALQLTPGGGISSVLIGKATVAETILKTQIENMDVILSGPAPPNASELIVSGNFPSIIEYGRKNYDYIIMDSPPLGIISDALVLMKYSDINLFILNTDRGSMDALNFAHKVVANNKIERFAFLLNNVKQKFSRYYYKNYRYAYGGAGYVDVE